MTGETTSVACFQRDNSGTSLMVQWLGLRASTAGGTGSIPGQGTKIPHAARHGQKILKFKIKFKKDNSLRISHFPPKMTQRAMLTARTFHNHQANQEKNAESSTRATMLGSGSHSDTADLPSPQDGTSVSSPSGISK